MALPQLDARSAGQRTCDLPLIGKATQLALREDDLPAATHLKATTAALNQFHVLHLLGKGGLELCRQTGGFLVVASGSAIFDTQVERRGHVVSPLLSLWSTVSTVQSRGAGLSPAPHAGRGQAAEAKCGQRRVWAPTASAFVALSQFCQIVSTGCRMRSEHAGLAVVLRGGPDLPKRDKLPGTCKDCGQWDQRHDDRSRNDP